MCSRHCQLARSANSASDRVEVKSCDGTGIFSIKRCQILAGAQAFLEDSAMSSSTMLAALATAAFLGTSVAHPRHASSLDVAAVVGASIAQQGQALTPPIRECQRTTAIAGPRASWAAGVRRVDELARAVVEAAVTQLPVGTVVRSPASFGGIVGEDTADAFVGWPSPVLPSTPVQNWRPRAYAFAR